MNQNQFLSDAQALNSIIEDLNKCFVPHRGQILVGNSLFYGGKKRIFVKCGRKWGKSSFTVYSLIRWAITHPGSGCYYIAPFFKQAKELIWADGRLQRFFTPELIQKYQIRFNNSELRMTFGFNNSFIKLEGADNYEALRGINPHKVAVDEAKDIRKEFWEGFEPNLAAHGAPVLIVGTPPDNTDNMFTHMEIECQQEDDGAFFNMPSFWNPHIDKDFLMKMKRRLIARGERDVWLREYMAQTVIGGSTSIFPMIDKERHVVSYDALLKEVVRTKKQWEFFVAFDPGTASCFGVLLGAINKYDKRIFLMDEIYEKDQRENTARKMFSRATEKWRSVNPYDDDWTKVYDYAAAWFAAEVADQFDEAVMPCTKDIKNKDTKLSLIKDALLRGYITMSDRCRKLYWEMINYRKDDKGKIIKENDHLIDCLRYILNAAHYDTVPENEVVTVSERRGFTIEEDMQKGFHADDLEFVLGGDLSEFYDY